MIDRFGWRKYNKKFGPNTGVMHFSGEDSDDEIIEALQDWADNTPGVTAAVDQVATRKGVSVFFFGISCEDFSHLYDLSKK